MAYLGAFNAMNTVSYLSKNKLIVYPNAIGFPQTAQADTLSMNNLIKYINGLINTVVTNSSGGGTATIDVASIWTYPDRTLTQGTKDAEIDTMKATIDKLKFNTNNEVLSESVNAELQNLDVSISSRASQTSLDSLFTTISNIPKNVWEYTSRTLTSFLGVASDVWSYATRTLTSGTKDIEIDAIKSQTDKLKFNTNNEVLSNATNTELQNLDAKISSRKPDVQDFTDDDRVKMQDIINNTNILLEIELGDWEIKNNQMIFYSVYGYELMRFNLYNKDGLPSEINVYKRERI
jgi:hypothetical protein